MEANHYDVSVPDAGRRHRNRPLRNAPRRLRQGLHGKAGRQRRLPPRRLLAAGLPVGGYLRLYPAGAGAVCGGYCLTAYA